MNKELLCTVGKLDIPMIQEQPYFQIDLLKSNILVIGSAGSGKSNLLKVIITEIHRELAKNELFNEQIYILDSSDSLISFNGFPFVKAHYKFDNEEYIKRVFYQIDEQYTENTRILQGMQFCEFTKLDCSIPHTTLIIDNINSFLDIKHNEKYIEKLIYLARDGQTKGISLVLVGSSTKGLSSLINYFQQKIALNLSNDEYYNLFSKKTIASKNVSGRGYANITYDASSRRRTFPVNTPYELQIFLMDGDNDFSDKIALDRRPQKLKRFPTLLTEGSYHSEVYGKEDTEASIIDSDGYDSESIDVEIGIEYTECKVVTTHYATSRVIAIYGKRNSEKPLLWKRLIKNFILEKEDDKYKYTFIMLDDGRKRLSQLYEFVSTTNKNDNKYFFNRAIPELKFDGSDKQTLSVIQRFVEYIQRNLYDFKGLKRSTNSSKPILLEIMPNNYKVGELPIPPDIPKQNCVFVIQAKDFFSNSIQANIFWDDIFPYLFDVAELMNWYFIITDTQRIPNSEVQSRLNSKISTAILLDDIAEFISDRGRRSVFGEMDAKDLKERFGLCEENDAYYYQLDTADLWKIKCIWDD